jgi:hypothetical protein
VNGGEMEGIKIVKNGIRLMMLKELKYVGLERFKYCRYKRGENNGETRWRLGK